LEENLLNSNVSPTRVYNMVNFGPLTAEICWRVWGTPAHFNGFRVLAALLHDTLVVIVTQTLRRRTEGATYIRQGGHHIGHWPTFVVVFVLDSVPWLKLRPLIARKLEFVIGEFLKGSPPGPGSVAGVNSDCVSFDEMRSRLVNCVNKFNR